MERLVSQVVYCLSKATNTSAKLADYVTICLTCFSRYLVLQHCESRSHFTRPLARVWPVILRNRPKFSANSLRSFPVKSGKFTTISEVAIAFLFELYNHFNLRTGTQPSVFFQNHKCNVFGLPQHKVRERSHD